MLGQARISVADGVEFRREEQGCMLSRDGANTSLTWITSCGKNYKSIAAYLTKAWPHHLLLSYASFISLISLLVRVQRISMRAISSQPEPFMALFSCWHKYSTGGDIRPKITSSNLPPSSLFKSFTKSCKIRVQWWLVDWSVFNISHTVL